MIGGNVGVSIKVSREHSSNSGVWQFEYAISDHLYWDVSDLDGAGPGKVASPFFDANVRVTPTGKGAQQGENGCYTLWCRAGETCVEAYQFPEQEATNTCPLGTGDLIVDMCLSDEEMEGGSQVPGGGDGDEEGSGDEGEWESEEDEAERWDGHEHRDNHWDRGSDLHGGHHWERKMTHGRRDAQ